MRFIADFHIHSKYSRATSRDMDIPALARWAKIKGIDLMGTGDFTHELWMLELKKYLKPKPNGIFEYEGVNFMLTAEVNNIFYVGSDSKRIHNIIFSPSIETCEKINTRLESYGNLSADARPILNMEASKLVEIVRDVDENCFIVPSHIWTPHFSLFGSNAGFDRIEDCFRDQTKHIFALETGLSSDPAMNWRLSALDRYSLISNSDAHSPAKIGREANFFDCQMSYFDIMDALKDKDKKKFLMTTEFFPQEGKYHYDGHRKCQASMAPEEAKANSNKCPKCGYHITVGVMHRVVDLSDRPKGYIPDNAIPFKNLIPLQEIIAQVKGKGVDTQGVKDEYNAIIQRFATEFDVLLNAKEGDLKKALSQRMAEAVIKVRNGEVNIHAGYDGEYGKIDIPLKEKKKEKQLEMF